MAKITISAYKCERCGHIWAPRQGSTEEPRVCPKCKNPYWNKPKKKLFTKKKELETNTS